MAFLNGRLSPVWLLRCLAYVNHPAKRKGPFYRLPFIPLERSHDHVGNDLVDTVDPYGVGQRSHVAVQPELGIFPERRSRAGSAHPSRTYFSWARSNRLLIESNDQDSMKKAVPLCLEYSLLFCS
jgi:hypothetical protein